MAAIGIISHDGALIRTMPPEEYALLLECALVGLESGNVEIPAAMQGGMFDRLCREYRAAVEARQ